MAARLPYRERDQARAAVQMAYDNVQKATGRVQNMFKLTAHHAGSFPSFVQWWNS